MLLWLIKAAGVPSRVVDLANRASKRPVSHNLFSPVAFAFFHLNLAAAAILARPAVLIFPLPLRFLGLKGADTPDPSPPPKSRDNVLISLLMLFWRDSILR
jgi:hypothetical protein